MEVTLFSGHRSEDEHESGLASASVNLGHDDVIIHTERHTHIDTHT